MEDASRLRDALGVPLPIGVPSAFLDPVADPVGDLVSRYVRTHGPFAAAGCGGPTRPRHRGGDGCAASARRATGASSRASSARARRGTEWVDAEVLRRLRRGRSRRSAPRSSPLPQRALGRFLPDWQHVAQAAGGLRGIDGVVSAIDQLAGVALPASAWESLVLPAACATTAPRCSTSSRRPARCSGRAAASCAGGDGWLACTSPTPRPLTLAEPSLADRTELHDAHARAPCSAAAPSSSGSSAQRSRSTGRSTTRSSPPRSGSWSGRALVTNDTLAPLRARLGATTTPLARDPASRAAARPRPGRGLARGDRPAHGRGPLEHAARPEANPTGARDGPRRAAARAARRRHPRRRRGRGGRRAGSRSPTGC